EGPAVQDGRFQHHELAEGHLRDRNRGSPGNGPGLGAVPAAGELPGAALDPLHGAVRLLTHRNIADPRRPPKGGRPAFGLTKSEWIGPTGSLRVARHISQMSMKSSACAGSKRAHKLGSLKSRKALVKDLFRL